MAKAKVRGKVTRAVIKHGKSLDGALVEAANRYTTNAQKAGGAFVKNLAEYLDFYVPRIEDYAMKEIANRKDVYFDKGDAGRDARIDVAVAVASKNSQLAREWRKIRRMNVLNMKLGKMQRTGTASSKKEDNIVWI